MRVRPTIAFRCISALLTGLLALACFGVNPVRAQAEPRQPVPIRFAFDRPIDAGAAPVLLASASGLFGSEGLAVTTDIAGGSADAIARVASGAADFALADISELIRFRGKSDAPQVKAVFVLFNQSPYAIVARKSRGIHALSDVEGKTLGVAEGDLSIRLWPALARRNGIKGANVKQSRIGAAVREPMLSAGQVDAVTGFSYLSAVNLRDRGVPADDLAVLRFADYGCEAYGFAVIVNPVFAARSPEEVKGFVRALIAGTHLAIKQPKRAVDEVISRMDGGSRDLELERLQTLIADNILTAEVRRYGIGGGGTAQLPPPLPPASYQHPSQGRGKALWRRPFPPPPPRPLDRRGRRGLQIRQEAVRGRYFRRQLPAAAGRPPHQLSKTRPLPCILPTIPA
jgi:NitT/TauT family transport system substrate-binding protein